MGVFACRFRLRRPTLKRPNTRPEKRRAGKAFWGSTPHAFLVGRPNPSGGRKEKFAQPKSGKLALHGSCVAFVLFMIIWWLNRLFAIDCSNSAAFLTAEQIFLKAWKARAFSFTLTSDHDRRQQGRLVPLPLHTAFGTGTH